MRVVVENRRGDIFDPAYLQVLKQVNDELFLTPRRRSRERQVAVDAGRALERSDRGRLQWRSRHARPLQRVRRRHRAVEAEHLARADPGQPGRQRLQVEHDLRALARQGREHRQSPGFLGAVQAARRDPRQACTGEWQHRHRHPHRRLCEGRGRPAGRPAAGDGVLRRCRGDRGRHHLLVDALCAQHGAGAGVLVDRRAVAARPGDTARLRARSLFDPGAVPRFRHRREPWRTEDERHHAGRGPRHAQAGGGPLYLPAPLPGRSHRIGGRCRGLRGADADRHSGDPGPGGHRQHRRGAAGLHQPRAVAGDAVVHRREHGCRRAQPEGRAGPARRRVAAAGALHGPALGQRGRGAGGVARRGWIRRQHAPEDRRPGRRRFRTPARLPLQPRQRLRHEPLRLVERPVRGDRQDQARRLPGVRDADRDRPARVGAAAGAGRADHHLVAGRGAQDHRRFVRRQQQVADDLAEPARRFRCPSSERARGRCSAPTASPS